MDNYTFGLAPNLPSPDENSSSLGQFSQPTTGSSTPMNIEYKTVGGSTSGVDASKGAITAIGANSLIVDQDQGMESLSSTGMSSDTSLKNPENAFLTAPDFSIDPQTKIEILGDHINVLKDMGPMFGLASSTITSALGKAGFVNSNRGVTTSATTTSSASTSSQGTSSESTEGAPPEDSVISMTEIEDDLGSLDNQESETLAQQQASQIDSIVLDASDTDAGAAKLLNGANMMLDMAIVGLAVSMAGSAYQLQGIGSAAKEGDQAEMQSIDEGNRAVSTASEKSLSDTELATTKEGAKDPRKYNDAQASIKEMELSAKTQAAKGTISTAQKESLDNEAAASRNALEQSRYLPGGTKNSTTDDVPAGWIAPKDEDNNTIKNSDGSNVSTPEQAVAFYQNQAKAEAATRSQQTTISYADLGRQGIRPGQTVSDETAKRALGTEDPGEIKSFQDHVKNLSINHNSSAWQNAYKSSMETNQIYAGTFMALSKMFDSLGSMKNQQGQALQQEDQAGAQVESSTEQAMNQGVQQTESIAESLRQSQSAVAQAMSSMVSATRV